MRLHPVSACSAAAPPWPSRSPRCPPPGCGCCPASAGAGSPRARAASSFITGIGDEHVTMFSTVDLPANLHTKIVRYIAPYDAVRHAGSLALATSFIRYAEAAHEQVLVAFYHSEYTPTVLPSVSTYQHDVEKFVRRFPHVRQYQSWDESNRGNVAHAFSSPSAVAAARYYQALLRVCKGCNVIGLDVLDANNIEPTLAYIAEFKREIGRLRTVMPSIWGLHNYSDINRLQSWRTHQLVRAMGGPGVAHRDRRDREIRRRVQQRQRLRPAALGEGAEVHVRGGGLDAADQAPVHLRLDGWNVEHPLRRRAHERPQPATRRL